MDRLILEAALFSKEFNIKKKTSQILGIISPILRVGRELLTKNLTESF